MANLRADSREGWNLIQLRYGPIVDALEALGHGRSVYRHITPGGGSLFLNAGVRDVKTNTWYEIVIQTYKNPLTVVLKTMANHIVDVERTKYLTHFSDLGEIFKDQEVLNWLEKAQIYAFNL